MLYILNVAIYTSTVYIVPFNACVCNSGIMVIFMVAITKIKYIVHIYVVIRIAMDKVLSDVRSHEFVFPYIEQVLINFDIFI